MTVRNAGPGFLPEHPPCGWVGGFHTHREAADEEYTRHEMTCPEGRQL